MSRRAPRRCGGDWLLAYTFRRNAAGFHEAAETARDRHPEVTRYFLAIAIELALKAYLLERGISDDWNRIHIRHDLTKALKCARRAGFNSAPAGLPALAALLSPYYEVHTISAMTPDTIGSVSWPEACDTVRNLIAAVSPTIDRDASDDEPSRMNKEGE
ncbi:hypothetical protein [Caulobacter sp. FWC2]|uniref:hypothetical protein n=1 Tax=Caulobacter sp. FWC2 TaxID=69664 RepID=UPI0018ED652B|nr:hypothetical protein [Caulobacter sp. FWC2]